MRIAITARGPSAESDTDLSFGRAYWYMIYDLKTKEWLAIDNNDIRNAISNAGKMACDLLEDHQVDILITGETGPKAFRFLTNAGIRVFHGATGTVGETLLAWSLQKLPLAELANSKGNPFCLSGASEQHQKPILAAPKLELANVSYAGGRI